MQIRDKERYTMKKRWIQKTEKRSERDRKGHIYIETQQDAIVLTAFS